MSAAQMFGQQVGGDLVEDAEHPSGAKAAAGQRQLHQPVAQRAFACCFGQFVGHQPALHRGCEVAHCRHDGPPCGAFRNHVPVRKTRANQLWNGPQVVRAGRFPTQQAEVSRFETL